MSPIRGSWGWLLVWLASPLWAQGSGQVDFNRDVRPLLSDRCFLCHGPDQTGPAAESTDLRLDQRDAALASGVFDLENATASELLRRIRSRDPGEQMPPPDSGKAPLTEAQIGILETWIAQGAKYQAHWAYTVPVKSPIPEVPWPQWQANPVDAFVAARLAEKSWEPAPAASRATLIRRLSLDLIGLPPTPQEVRDFEQDPQPLEAALARVVDRLLASPHYGEQRARYWLDAARYADTSGYQYDRERTQWVWRDWVIDAFNRNLPFDEFTIQQMAGDLLPDATPQTRLATGFHRNHPITIEGGVVDEEYRTEYVIDRVVTTATVWMGQTMICARCHDHKYDPLSQTDFYRLMAFFNNVPERGLNGFDPQEKIVSPLGMGQFEALQAAADRARLALQDQLGDLQQLRNQWRNRPIAWEVFANPQLVSSGGAEGKRLEDGSLLLTGKNPAEDDYQIDWIVQQPFRHLRLEALRHPDLTEGSASRGTNGNFVLTELVLDVAPPEKPDQFEPVKLIHATADFEQDGFPVSQAIDGQLGKQGWAVAGHQRREDRWAQFELQRPVPAGSRVRVRMLHRYGLSHQIGRLRLSTALEQPPSPELVQWLQTEDPMPSDRVGLELAARSQDPKVVAAGQALEQALQQVRQAGEFPPTMILREMEQPRPTYVLQRGEYDKPITSQPLTPGVPAALGALPEGAPLNRLGLAQWLVSDQQPLTARVTVNRIWQQFFGVGLVKTTEDFGFQGEYPSHRELLDWLAVDFMEHGWDIKRLIRTIVLSRTYQQDSRITERHRQEDPENRLLARGPRLRLDAEAIRDTALAVSGLLQETVGGASVYPYHPVGLWLEINNRPNFSRAYPHQQDLDQHVRRSLYTFWKRTVPPPSLATFDAPDREYCIVRRSRTNTPLQSLVMLHDPQFVEAARNLAVRMLREGGATDEERLEYGFRLCLSRAPQAEESQVLLATLARHQQRYQDAPPIAEQFLSVGVSPVPAELSPVELAAWSQVARLILNLSEFITKS